MMARERQHFIPWVILIALASFLVTSDAMAADLHDPSGAFRGLLDLVEQSASSWDAKLRAYAKTLFWLLASIQFVWTFFPLVFKQADFGEIVGELIRFIMVIGFFYALLIFSAEWGGAVIDSFRTAGATAAGLGTSGIRPHQIFAVAVDLANTVGNVETWNPLTAFMIALSALVVLLCFAFIAAFMGLTIIESYVVINASTLFMGFGASQWTREYALAIIRYAVSVGAKLFILTLIVGLIVDSAKEWAAAYSSNADDASMWTMVGLALTCAYLAKTIPELIAGMISGVSSGGGSSVGGMAAAAVAGAAAAAATIATMGAAAPAAAGAAGGLGAGGSAAGAAGAGGLGGGGLAAAINSSFAGGGAAGAGGAASAGGGAASAGASGAGLGSGTGGSAAAKTSGAKVGGSSAGSDGASGSAPQASEGVQKAAKQAAKATQGGDDSKEKGTDQPQAAAPGGQGAEQQGMAQEAPAAQAEGAQEKEGGISGHQVANALTRGAGLLAAISVPGMEGAAGLSLGAPPQTPDSGGEDPSMEAKGDDTPNLIRPADTSTTPVKPAAVDPDTKGE